MFSRMQAFAVPAAVLISSRAGLRTVCHSGFRGLTNMSATTPSPSTLPERVQSVVGNQPVFAQTMLRCHDPKQSISFYESLGLQYLGTLAFPEFNFSLYFLAVPDESVPAPPPSTAARSEFAKYLWSLPCITLELTHNWPGSDPPEVYVSGNEEPRGYGHIALSGVSPPKNSTVIGNGKSYNVLDPDGYSVLLRDSSTNSVVYSQVLLRVGNPRKSVTFFERLGMRRLARIEDEDNGSSSFYMGYYDEELPTENIESWLASLRIPVVHLQHSWRRPQKLVNGNEKPYRGFGHLGVICDDIYKVSKEMEELGYQIVRHPSPFLDVGEIAFVKDDDVGYWVELISRSKTAAEV